MKNNAWIEKLRKQGIEKSVLQQAVETAELMSGKANSKTRPLTQSSPTEGFAQYLKNISEPKV